MRKLAKLALNCPKLSSKVITQGYIHVLLTTTSIKKSLKLPSIPKLVVHKNLGGLFKLLFFLIL